MSTNKSPSENRIRIEKYQDLLQTTHHSSGHLHHLSRGVHLPLHSSQDSEENKVVLQNIWKDPNPDSSFRQQEREGYSI